MTPKLSEMNYLGSSWQVRNPSHVCVLSRYNSDKSVHRFLGHETTATTICWGLKFLTKHQDVQQKLRSALQGAFQQSWERGNNPTIDEIAKGNVPYLDATLEEMHRCGGTVSSNIRTALVDTEVLGHRIPKGTDVFMVSLCVSFTSLAAN